MDKKTLSVRPERAKDRNGSGTNLKAVHTAVPGVVLHEAWEHAKYLDER